MARWDGFNNKAISRQRNAFIDYCTMCVFTRFVCVHDMESSASAARYLTETTWRICKFWRCWHFRRCPLKRRLSQTSLLSVSSLNRAAKEGQAVLQRVHARVHVRLRAHDRSVHLRAALRHPLAPPVPDTHQDHWAVEAPVLLHRARHHPVLLLQRANFHKSAGEPTAYYAKKGACSSLRNRW